MPEEQGEALPRELQQWVEAAAAERGVDPAEILARAVVAYRVVEGHGDTLGGPSDALLGDGALDGRVDNRIGDLEGRVAAVEADLDEKISDVRSRVIQVKRESDGKAPADHDHPAIERRAERAASEAEAANRRLDDLARRLDGGFDNFEEILTSLSEEAEALDETLSRLATIAVDLRSRVATLEAAEARRRAVDELKAEANRRGTGTAACDECGSRVRIGLLTEARCPHCGATYVGVEPGRRFFGSATLTVGSRPALRERYDDEDQSPPDFAAHLGEEER